MRHGDAQFAAMLLFLAVACLLFMTVNLIHGELANAAADAFVALCLVFVAKISKTKSG
jgi:hypothetical protein